MESHKSINCMTSDVLSDGNLFLLLFFWFFNCKQMFIGRKILDF